MKYIVCGAVAGIIFGLLYIAAQAIKIAIDSNQFSTNLCYADLIRSISEDLEVSVNSGDLSKVESVRVSLEDIQLTYDTPCEFRLNKYEELRTRD